MGLVPDATNVTVRQVLRRLDGEFASTARAIENGEFALWVGSGISRKAPSLGGLIAAAMEYLRARAVDPATQARYLPALDEALQLAGKTRADIGPDIDVPFTAWDARDAIVDALWNSYSRVLDIRVEGEPDDFILWTAIDIRRQFSAPPPPAAAHLCVAILVLEGAVRTIASGNWDGFIEAAVHRLGGGVAGILQVVVDPNQLRDPPGRATLLKFHGCIVHAEQDEARYRRFLTGSHTQISMWPVNPDFAAMRIAVLDAATNRKTIVLGLSIQDLNLQGIFAAATGINPWPWPCAPDAPGHVFCEERITQGQRDVLRIVYGPAYNANVAAINDATHMRAWGEQVLVALVLRMIADKLNRLMELALTAPGKAAFVAPLVGHVNDLRDRIADGALVDAVDGSRTPAVNAGIGLWSRLVSVFRGGQLQQDPAGYEAISSTPTGLLVTDQNARASRLGNLTVALALLEHGWSTARWTLGKPANDDLVAGVASLRANRAGAPGCDLLPRRGGLIMARRTTSLTALAAMSAAELAAEWERLHGSPSPSLTPALLRLAIGYRLQEKAHGGLPAAVIRELARVAAGPAGGPDGSAPVPSASVSPGTRLVRTWGGRTIEVLALDDGFLFDGQTFGSLTAIAVAVTGARWSGPRFFGLTRHA